jgi:RNA polymerase sigma-70 factor (ECF subfamily)
MLTVTTEQTEGMADASLLQQIKQKDPQALGAFYDRHAPTVFGLLLRMVRNHDVAEELLQDTFWQVWQKAEQYAGAGPVTAWLLRIARNKALDELRRQQTRPRCYHDELEQLEHCRGQQTPVVEQQVEQTWVRQSLAQALAQIPTEQRHCLEMAFFDGLSHTEIAEQTSTPLGTVKTRIRSGMTRVERTLRGIGYLENYA